MAEEAAAPKTKKAKAAPVVAKAETPAVTEKVRPVITREDF